MDDAAWAGRYQPRHAEGGVRVDDRPVGGFAARTSGVTTALAPKLLCISWNASHERNQEQQRSWRCSVASGSSLRRAAVAKRTTSLFIRKDGTVRPTLSNLLLAFSAVLLAACPAAVTDDYDLAPEGGAGGPPGATNPAMSRGGMHAAGGGGGVAAGGSEAGAGGSQVAGGGSGVGDGAEPVGGAPGDAGTSSGTAGAGDASGGTDGEGGAAGDGGSAGTAGTADGGSGGGSGGEGMGGAGGAPSCPPGKKWKCDGMKCKCE